MSTIKHINIATKAYQQACKYGHVSREKRKELFDYIESWFSSIEKTWEDYEEEIEGLDLEDQFEKLMEEGE